MTDPSDLLIIGAGPTGLAAALFLAEKGHRPRIIDRSSSVSPYSKAFGVNVRTLHLLSSSGVAERFLANGRRMERLNLHRRSKILQTLRFTEVDETFPFMLVQSQSDSERILEDALAKRGVTVERGVEAAAIRMDGGMARVRLRSANAEETVIARTVLGADGADSMVRNGLNFNFKGAAYKEPWRLWDMELDTPLDPNDGHIFLLDHGGMFVVRHADNIWRVLGSGPDLLGALPAGTRTGPVHWESEFRISNRVAGTFSKGPIHIAGDAAHVHAGIGARGMNLGIEDAYVFAELYHKNELDRYSRLRRPIIKRVVSDIIRLMSVPRADAAPGRVVRAMPWLVRLAVPLVRSRVQPWILGLDHPVKF